MSNHTPGPWRFAGSTVEDSRGRPLLRSVKQWADFNALDIHLAASAPDLLAACENAMLELIQPKGGWPSGEAPGRVQLALNELTAAIAKAKGEAR
jgi:hypothetical protein